jgi:hypothetical protein
MNLNEKTKEELYRELKMLNETYFNKKTFIVHLLIIVLTILLGIYAIKDNFSIIIFLLIIYPIFHFTKNVIHRKNIVKEIKYRN